MFERPDGSREAIGCGALILASGGFAANRDKVARHMPEAAVAKHNGHEGNRGDGIWLAEALGAAVGDMGSYQGYAMLTDPQGISVPPGVIIEGGMLVNTHRPALRQRDGGHRRHGPSGDGPARRRRPG